MIFITVGSQKFQFNRLLKEIDKLIEEEKITEEVFAQIGYSTYEPKNYKYSRFLNNQQFRDIMAGCDKVITHGGTGSIISAISNDKKVIAVARLSKYDEHVDNHQLDIINQFTESNYILGMEELDNIDMILKEIEKIQFDKYISNTKNIINIIEDFIK
ncbi:UDP-N-acetylglucosamine transferase subunit ALG13 [Clostridium cavendishii DSM 21758]|uniref:UDP-N-acetylglucosamine transferase subunit ALG13 n=1 Tax=Clostridium cavendishii DSM 21758 TaxID=1121302 RepID=A0A1M6Q9P0_9CLOT|nr:PssE/Cps14G family polysaccharide biosynthesis glycosyltransferase [Clostridium cavendishii]SHK16865.1 UDP-N-acetylglucosamine transferase subunit ALG13 [Clostridium cavendishii DSM 21758]